MTQKSFEQDTHKQWIENRKLMDKLDCFKLNPRLNLYSSLDLNQIQRCNSHSQELLQQIDFNEKLKQSLPPSEAHSLLKEDLSLQNLQLKIAVLFNASLNERTQRHFPAAMELINKTFEEIQIYAQSVKKTDLKVFKSPEEFLGQAYYHKGKIHRMLAGYALDHLNANHLQECEKNYHLALEKFQDSHAIHGSLGYLYLDMKKSEMALFHLEKANQLYSNFPDYLHGIAYAYFHIENQKFEQKMPLNFENLNKSEKEFEKAIQLFQVFQTFNSRILLDFGKLKLLMNRPLEALEEFNKGLKLEPYHPLLLLERGMLLGKLGHHKAALNDLRNGCIVNSSDICMHKKYLEAINNEEMLWSSSFENLSEPTVNSSQKILSSVSTNKRFELEKVLEKCAEYLQDSNKRPTCFISYAWNILAHEQWVEQFAADLEKAGIHILLDRWFTRKGQETMDFVEKILAEDTDFIIVVGTKLYLEKYQQQSFDLSTRERVVKIEVRLLNHLIGYSQLNAHKVIPILLEGTPTNSLPPLLRQKNIVDFTEHEYGEQLLELIRDLHGINQRDPQFRALQKSWFDSNNHPSINSLI